MTIDDLRLAFKFCRNLSSISGHGLTLRSGLELCHQNVFWIVFLREPIRRYVSHYQYRMDVMAPQGRDEFYNFDRWLLKGGLRNLQTRRIAGKEDFLAAKSALLHKYDFVGIVERFDESLLLLQNRLKKEYDVDFRIEYRKKNVAKSKKIATEILEEKWDEYQQRIIENNSLDIQLYDFAVGELFERQLEKYSGSLSDDLASFRCSNNMTSEQLLNLWMNRVQRRLITNHLFISIDESRKKDIEK